MRQAIMVRNAVLAALVLALCGCSTVSGLEQAYDEGRTKNAESDMTHISQMLEFRYYSHGTLPDTLDVFNPKMPGSDEVLVNRIPTDPWGNAYSYRKLSAREYELRSGGPDDETTCDDIVSRRTVCN